MSTLQDALNAIAALPLTRPVRILSVCGDQERVISWSDMRQQLPAPVELVPGPGCAASICPESDVLQALQLVQRHDLTLLVSDNLMRVPLSKPAGGPRSLTEAMSQGADIRPVSAPVDAVVAARAQPQREMVFFVSGFETLLAPLAGMVLEGLPENLTLLLCGRRAEPLIGSWLSANAERFDALLLPGNRCAVTGTDAWDRLSSSHAKPAAVAGYTVGNLLSAVHAVLEQVSRGKAEVVNFYRTLARPGGNALARDQLERVFEPYAGDWRGLGAVDDTGYRLRRTYDVINADRRYPDYRSQLQPTANFMPDGCECAGVLDGSKSPVDCPLFVSHCTPESPFGPCMASEDGTCFLHRRPSTQR